MSAVSTGAIGSLTGDNLRNRNNGNNSNSIVRNEILGGLGYPTSQTMQASLTGPASSADANSISATGFNPNTGNTTPTLGNDIGGGDARLTDIASTAAPAGIGNVDPQVLAGGFSPNTSVAAEGIFGSEQARGIQPYKKPLINF